VCVNDRSEDFKNRKQEEEVGGERERNGGGISSGSRR
jgi:hypothetical protein